MNNAAPDPGRLRAFVTSVQHINGEIADLQLERRELFKSIKEAGFEPGIVKMLIGRMAMEPLAVIEMDTLLETYEEIMGTGAFAAGSLATSRDAEGRFVIQMVQAPPAEAKPTAKTTARRSSVALAEAARRAREIK